MKKNILSPLFFALIFALIFSQVCYSKTKVSNHDYEISIIGPVLDQDACNVYGINESGQIVGKSYDYDVAGKAINLQAFICGPSGSYQILPGLVERAESSVWGINDSGQVSGYSFDADYFKHAVRWDYTGSFPEEIVVVDIGTLYNKTTYIFGDTGRAYGINNNGQVAGCGDIPNDYETFMPYHPFLYDDAPGIFDIGTFASGCPQWQNGYGIAYGLNNNSAVVGVTSDGSWKYQPFLYKEAEGLLTLKIDPSYSGGEWYAVAINDAGLIGGHVIVSKNWCLPYYWEDGSSDPLPLPMPGEFPFGEIYGINESGQMVGVMWYMDGENKIEHAFVYDTVYGVRDLNDITDYDFSGSVLIFARDINNSGLISGTCEINGLKRGFVLYPVYKCACDLDGDGVCDIKDWLLFTKDWRKAECNDLGVDCDCDINNDGKCDEQDYMLFGEDWGNGDCR